MYRLGDPDSWPTRPGKFRPGGKVARTVVYPDLIRLAIIAEDQILVAITFNVTHDHCGTLMNSGVNGGTRNSRRRVYDIRGVILSSHHIVSAIDGAHRHSPRFSGATTRQIESLHHRTGIDPIGCATQIMEHPVGAVVISRQGIRNSVAIYVSHCHRTGLVRNIPVQMPGHAKSGGLQPRDIGQVQVIILMIYGSSIPLRTHHQFQVARIRIQVSQLYRLCIPLNQRHGVRALIQQKE